jgi:hypothetical protein
MEQKHLVQRCAYRIEPKPEGGFIARATDPSVPPLEAPTREELQQKIQAKFLAELGETFPGLKLPALQNKQVKWEVHIDRKPGGGFSVHSEEPGAPAGDPATHQKIDHFAEELLGFVDKHFPELSQAIANQADLREVKVFTGTGATARLDTSSSLGSLKNLLPMQPVEDRDVKAQELTPEAATIEGITLDKTAISNQPITPEAGNFGSVLRFMFALLMLAALMFYFLHR